MLFSFQIPGFVSINNPQTHITSVVLLCLIFYAGEYYNSCIDHEYKSDDNSTTKVKFCATTNDYDKDQKWVIFLNLFDSF